MNHTLFPGCKLNKRAKLFNADNFTLEDLTFLEIGNDHLDHFDRLIHHFLLSSTYADRAVIRDIDLHTGSGNDLIDRLSSLSDNVTDLLRIDLDLNDLRRIFANGLSRLCDRRLHAILHNIHACLAAACDRAFHNRLCQTMDLNIHLDRGNSGISTRYLEIHVTEEIFQSLNIRQQYKIIVRLSGHKSAGNACNHFSDRNTCRHQRHTGSTGGRHGSRTVRFKRLGYGTDRIRKFFLRRKHGKKRTLCKRAMTDLAASRSTADLRLPNGVGREIIMVHIAFCRRIFVKPVHSLYLGERCKRADITNLCLSARKHCGAMHTRYDINFCRKWSYLSDLSSVRTLLIF